MNSKSITRILALAALLFVTTLPVVAQEKHKLNRYLDSVLSVRYQRADIDTHYVVRPDKKWTLTGRLNVSGARIMGEGKRDGTPFETRMTADYKTTVCVGVSYLGLSAFLSLNPGKLLGKYNDYELNFQSYSPRFGFDIAYQDAHNFQGWYEVDGGHHDVTTSDEVFRLRTLNANAYYVFNSRRFSYPAAFVHSYIQRRSAGSFLLAVSGQGQHGKLADEGEILDESHRRMDFKMTNIAIGGGYGYNYVPADGWLIHFSALPTYIIYSRSTISIGDTEARLRHHFPEGILTTRAAVVKQIGRNKVAGLSVRYNFTTIGDADELAVRNQKWRTRLYFGIRL